ncbi:hypothetical protein [Kitasatospora sp. NPDC007106]
MTKSLSAAAGWPLCRRSWLRCGVGLTLTACLCNSPMAPGRFEGGSIG